MSIANLHFSRIFIQVSHPLYICKHFLQAAMDKEDCVLADIHNSAKVLVTHSEYTIYHEHLPGKLTQDGIADTIAVSKQNRVVFNL